MEWHVSDSTSAFLSPVRALHVLADTYSAELTTWLERCALSGIDVSTDQDELSGMWHAAAKRDLTAFIGSWLNLTPSGRDGVISLLKGMIEVPQDRFRERAVTPSDGPAIRGKAWDRYFSKVESALQRIERAVRRLKIEASLQQIQDTLSSARLVPYLEFEHRRQKRMARSENVLEDDRSLLINDTMFLKYHP
jgi:hypothetical protein